MSAPGIGSIDLAAAVEQMRALGVTRLKAEGFEIELGPAPEAPPVLNPTPARDDPPPVCACGHPHADHNEAGCGHGCDLDRCAGTPERVPEEEKTQ